MAPPLTTPAGLRSAAEPMSPRWGLPCKPLSQLHFHTPSATCWGRQVCLEDDEDVIALRKLEEEEERRQEEERKAFLAEREAALQRKAAGSSPRKASVEVGQNLAGETAEVSEDEEDWLEQMQRAEAEEAERQERERQEWLKQKGDTHTS